MFSLNMVEKLAKNGRVDIQMALQKIILCVKRESFIIILRKSAIFA
jgi:hypothetical protein